MKTSPLILSLFISSVASRLLPAYSGSNNLDKCHTWRCSRHHFNCECEKDGWRNRTPSCIPSSWMCDGWKDCDDGSDEQECSCPPGQHQCSWCEKGGACNGNIHDNLYQCVPLTKYGNGIDEPYSRSFDKHFTDCFSRKDEREWYKRECDLRTFSCNGYLTCTWRDQHDEICNSTACPIHRPIPCDCNKPGNFTCAGRGPTCYHSDYKCNGFVSCPDSSDELGCSCEANEFQCHCYVTNPVTCPIHQGCIPSYKVNDGISDCPDDSDENRYRARGNCNQCQVTIKRFENKQQCQSTDNFDCNVTTCYEVASFHKNVTTTTDVLCSNATSCSDISNHEICARGFLCDDNGLTLATQFCDGRIDCLDESDEIRHGPGFKCVGPRGICVLPQINLYDDVAQCSDQSDLCFVMKNDVSCFQCFDKRLWISSKQVCDGTRDCFDYSDECLCEDHLYDDICIHLFPDCDVDYKYKSVSHPTNHHVHNHSIETIKCRTKYGETTATLCDGQPECRDFSDECDCPNRARFCDDNCHSFYPIGDRYCDGYEDEAWKYINDSNCPKGFDERFCPNRFRCKAGNRVSISISQKCNGVNDCDDGVDEIDCFNESNDYMFSSETKMIKDLPLRLLFWIMGFVVLAGNSYVIIGNSKIILQSNANNMSLINTIVVTNIAVADLIMGVYLITIASYSAYYAGYYGQVDVQWRTSLRCSVIGSLAVISSETSCFLMVLMTIFRLYTLSNPLTSLTVSLWNWSVGILVIWLLSFLIAILPIVRHFDYYFVGKVWALNTFTANGIWNKRDFVEFACRLAKLTNKTIEAQGNRWQSTLTFLERNFPEYNLGSVISYYGETSVCLPKLFVVWGEHSWEFTFALISVNFFCFVFIAVSYVIIYQRSTNRPVQFSCKRSVKRDAIMQRRVARIIVSDFVCWVPICVMVYLSLSGVKIVDVAYIVCACVLLPINSAFNPFLYSSLPDRLVNLIRGKRKFLTSTFSLNSQQRTMK